VKFSLLFVPPGGGETDYQLEFELPAPPQPGDYISVRREDTKDLGTEDFIVRRTWWSLTYPGSAAHDSADGLTSGELTDAYVECEFAEGPFSSERHKINSAH
jgi:hypothetical protein